MIAKKNLQAIVKAIEKTCDRLKMDSYDVIIPIPSMPDKFKEFHGESGAMLLLLRERLIAASHTFLVELLKLKEEITNGSFTQTDMDEIERKFNNGEPRKRFLNSLNEMREALAILSEKYGPEAENMYQEYKRSKNSDA